MPDLKLLQTLAHRKGDCPVCIGQGKMSPRPDKASPPLRCSNCDGTGKVFVLPGVVRVKCLHPYAPPTNCPLCSGLGTVASQDMGDWVRALTQVGYVVHFHEGICIIVRSGRGYKGINPDIWQALTLAIQKAVGKETDVAI